MAEPSDTTACLIRREGGGPPQLAVDNGDQPLPRRKQALAVLLVEDDPEDVYLLGRHLAALGRFDVTLVHAATLEAARAAFAGTRFDLALCDFWLGGDTAVPLIAEIDALNGARCPVVLLSNLENDDIELIGRRAGASGFVTKADLSADALDAILATLFPSPVETAPPDDPAAAWRRTGRGVAGWLRSLLTALDRVHTAGAHAQAGQEAETEILRAELVRTLDGLEKATVAAHAAFARFDLVPLLSEAVGRIRETADAHGGTVDYHEPRLPIVIEADGAAVVDAVQGLAAEALAIVRAGGAVRIAPAVRDGAIEIIVWAVDGSATEEPEDDAVSEVTREVRRLVVGAIAGKLGGGFRIAGCANRDPVAALRLPLRSAG